ncbi:sugar transferase [Pontibacter sp. 172403-2]|uniref:sugar transferase n=1 Tax=Pontibacter rufus TaxID=2791028 RepID=UPI0018B01115|nr:sugar transferase [Pontibacter sp. 172403-2]MBF9253263.1 sugar transferase [Pontibacter sp. 172403-2]
MQIELSPIAVFAYKRVDTLCETINALKKCELANQSDLFVFSDGAKGLIDISSITHVREYLTTIDGFKSVTIYKSEENKGLARSIIDGVTNILNSYDSIIVLEDDHVTSSNFLLYMNQCLDFYKRNKAVGSISGYSPPLKYRSNYNYDAYFFSRNCSNGWATWKDRWEGVDWEVKDYSDFIASRSNKDSFNYGGSDLTGMLKRQMEGKINSWSIRFCYHQYKTKAYTVYPIVSKIYNIGFGAEATNTTNTFNHMHTPLDQGTKLSFHLPKDAIIDADIRKMSQEFYSLKTRGINKVKTYLCRIGLLKNI